MVAKNASILSSNQMIRQALVARQRAFKQPPGLVTDGRDMGTVVFPDADYKFYLIASAAERAKRRYKQLQQLGINGNLRDIERDLIARDERDSTRTTSPMVAAADAVVIDTTNMAITDVMTEVLAVVDR